MTLLARAATAAVELDATGLVPATLYAAITLSSTVLIWPIDFCAMPWPIDGTLDTMASPKLAAPVFCIRSWLPTSLVTPSMSNTGFLAIRAVTVWLAVSVRPVADCCSESASVSDNAEVALMEVVALEMAPCALVLAVRTLVRVVASAGLTACIHVQKGSVSHR